MRGRTLAAMIALSISLPVASFADSEIAPRPRITTDPFGDYYFKMVPAGDQEAGGNGFLYRVTKHEDRLMYTTSGWYAHRVYVAHGGQFICRLGNWGRTGAWYRKIRNPDYAKKDRVVSPSPDEHIAIAFYEEGKLIKAYTVSDLIPDIEDLQFSFSHYSFEKSSRYLSEHLTDFQKDKYGTAEYRGYWVVFETVDGQTIVFNMRTGLREGGEEMARAFDTGERKAYELAKEYLQANGVGGGHFSKIRREGDFDYRIFYEANNETLELLLDRKTGSVTLE